MAQTIFPLRLSLSLPSFEANSLKDYCDSESLHCELKSVDNDYHCFQMIISSREQLSILVNKFHTHIFFDDDNISAPCLQSITSRESAEYFAKHYLTNLPLIIAGPCAYESVQQFQTIVSSLMKQSQIHWIRAGIFKPRTSPYSFQGLGSLAIDSILQLKGLYNFRLVTEITAIEQYSQMDPVTDMFQVGARNMGNFELLKFLSKQKKPVLLKRNFGATIKEYLLSGEYLALGNCLPLFCERGIRTFSDTTKYTLDLGSIIALKQSANIPVIVDPSHAAGKREHVIPLAKAALAYGADGIIVEVHHQPQSALSDRKQALSIEEFITLHSSAIYSSEVIET